MVSNLPAMDLKLKDNFVQHLGVMAKLSDSSGGISHSMNYLKICMHDIVESLDLRNHLNS